MKTIILPGYSEHNREWAAETAAKIDLDHEVVIHPWRHWSEDVNFSLKYEVEKIIEEIARDKVNIIAKSVGVMVALNLVPKIATQVNKIILCGIASVVDEKRNDLLKNVLNSVKAEDILCIQNANDKYVPFAEAEKFYNSVEPKLKVISKPRSDHDYPFPDDFRNFLKS